MNHQAEISKGSLVVSSIFIFLIILLCGVMGELVLSDPALKYSQVLANAAVVIRDNYVDSFNWAAAADSAREAMTDELDPFSRYVGHEQLEQFMEDLSGGYCGIGISVVPVDSGLLVYDVREGSPAATSGVLPGDILIASDSTGFIGYSSAEALRIIRGKEGTILSAKVFRPATLDTLYFDIIRKRIGFLHIPFAGYTPDSVVYIRLLDFNAGAADDFRNTLDTLIGINGRNAKGIIIDLRDNPGGLFNEAIGIAGSFLKKGEFIVGTSSRSKWNEESHFAESDGEYFQLPLAILTDIFSASAAEVLAGTLKYSGHAVLVGDTTFGKGLVQEYIRLPEGDALRLTISRYFFEGNRYINPLDSAADVHGVGLSPDVVCTYVEDEPFYLQLEWKLILLRFAHIHQDEIVSAAHNKNEKNRWLKEFRKYAYENEFSYKSETTESAERLANDSESSSLKKLADHAVRIAKLQDQKLFEKYGDFLWMRLCQIAFERKFGAFRAYKEIVVPQYEPIKMAAAALSLKD